MEEQEKNQPKEQATSNETTEMLFSNENEEDNIENK